MPEIYSGEILPENLVNQSLVLYQDNLFIGFDADVLERAVEQGDCRVLSALDDLKEISSSIRRVFIASACDPKMLRSMFIANAVERDRLVRGERLPHKLSDIVFPTVDSSPSAKETRQNLLADSDTEIVCVNTEWSRRAVGNWLKRSVDIERPVNMGILGLGRIGFEVAKSILLSAYLMHDNDELGFDFGSLNIFNGKQPKDAFLMELRHIADPCLREINQCGSPEETLRNSDIVLFIASDAVPPLSIVDETQGDVRLLQFDYNYNTLREVVEAAKKVDFSGQLIVVSDPPEHLSTAVNSAAMHRVSVERNADEIIGNHQLPALAGRLNWARALHIIRETRDPDLVKRFLGEGAVFGAHGPGALVADSVHAYNRGISRVLSWELGRANYTVRKAGKLPCDAPGVNLAINILEMLRGDSVPISLGFGGTTVGVYGRFNRRLGCHEAVPFFNADRQLVEDVVQASNAIRSTTEIIIGSKDVETRIPMRTSAFWANKVITHQAVPTRFFPTCSGRSIASFRAIVVEPYHLSREQGDVFLPEDKEIRDMVESVMDYFNACFEIRSAESAVADDATKTVDDRMPDVVSEPNEFAEKAAIISIGRVGDAEGFNLDGYKSRYPLYLEIEVDVSTSSNIALIEKLVRSGGICLGFTPQIFDKKTLKRRSAHLHFGFIGDNVRIEEKPEVPLMSSISGHEQAIRVFRNWKACFTKIVKNVGKDNCGKSHRESRIEEGRALSERCPGLKLSEVLIGEAYYGESSVLFEHVLNVYETAEDLLRILHIDGVDKELLGRLCMLHDIGKAVYLNLSHYVCAYGLQKANEYDGTIHPVSESDIGHDAWRYGVHCDELRQGKLVQLPAHLERFRKFIDLEAGTIERDTVIARELIEQSIVLKDTGVLKEKLMAFVDSDVDLEVDMYIFLTELADNLSDYGRMDDIEDIIKYLDLKERYALHRYGNTVEVQESIRNKFSKLRTLVSKLR